MVAALALMRTPTDPSRAGIILAQGTLSLVSHSASGFFGTLARVSASAGQAVAALSLDADYRNWHREIVVKTTNLGREWKKRGLQNTGKIILRPFADLLIGVSGGVAGVVVQPIKGFRQDGAMGLLRGAAIGLIGLIAKPIVGIFDSFAHFTASVHDIAKSVNLLEKRDGFATRLRKSYSFGPLGVLATYNTDVARAKQLLHEFPLRLSFQATFPAEIIIHVEFLPGAISYETALIATSQRIAVIQVREELAGYPVADLCWQAVYAVDSIVQSKLDDQRYGHGASLCLMSKRFGDTHSRTESSDDVLNEPKPGPSSKLAVPRGLSTPKERQRSWKAPRESETNSGTDGSATKRFTIIAEYQFRQQLACFHNVVCCISGRFDDLLFEGPEDTPNNYVDGLTCFGMFLFDRPTAVAIMRDESIVKLDNVPWIPKFKIVEYSEKSPNEQKLLISALQEHWTLSDEMEAARNEGGPSWLVEAKARSRFIEPVANQRNAKQSRTLSWAEDEELSEYLELEDGTETNSFVQMPPSSLQGYAATHQRVEDDDNNEEDVYLDNQFPAASDGVKFHSSRHSAPRMSALSFQSPLRGSNNAMRRSDFNASFATANSYHTPRSSDGPDRLRTSETSRDRLDRMEDLVEQLVLVATESTMRARRNEFPQPEISNSHNHHHHNLNHHHNSNSELVRLRQEVDELRAQNNPDGSSTTSAAAAAHEMARLRSEVATLRAQLEQKEQGGNTASATTREQLDLAENMSAEQVD
jgi:hypothetical protein